VRIGLLSDTHGFLDEAVLAYFAECDEVWHAGDFGSVEVLDQLKTFKPTRGVYGNVDGAELRAALPQNLDWDCEGLRVFMTHIGGYPGNYDARAKKELIRIRPGLFICGHSHILKVMRDQKLGLLHMNPGACGHNGWHTVRTMLRFTVEKGEISAVEAIELGPRGRKL
jgi:putative phosphoesterase